MSMVSGNASSSLTNKLFTRVKDTLSGNFSALGLVNIYQKAGDPQLEKKILEDGASYGYQLGILIDIVDQLVSTMVSIDKNSKAFQEFSKLKSEIQRVKRSHHGTPDELTLIDQLDWIAEHDPKRLKVIQAHINQLIEA